MISSDLFHDLTPRLRRLAARFHVPPADVDDLVQDAWLTLVRNGDRIQDPEAWLIRTLYLLCCTWYRRRALRQRLQFLDAWVLDQIASPAAPSQTHREHVLDLRALLSALPRRQQMLIALRYGLGLSPDEIAARLGCQPGSVGKLSQRALSRLQSLAGQRG